MSQDSKRPRPVLSQSFFEDARYLGLIMDIMGTYIVGCQSDYRDNPIPGSPWSRDKTFDGVLKLYYYRKLGHIIIHFSKVWFPYFRDSVYIYLTTEDYKLLRHNNTKIKKIKTTPTN